MCGWRMGKVPGAGVSRLFVDSRPEGLGFSRKAAKTQRIGVCVDGRCVPSPDEILDMAIAGNQVDFRQIAMVLLLKRAWMWSSRRITVL